VVFGQSSNVCGLPVYQRSGDPSCGQWRLWSVCGNASREVTLTGEKEFLKQRPVTAVSPSERTQYNTYNSHPHWRTETGSVSVTSCFFTIPDDGQSRKAQQTQVSYITLITLQSLLNILYIFRYTMNLWRQFIYVLAFGILLVYLVTIVASRRIKYTKSQILTI
jgi:hypothetical protein